MTVRPDLYQLRDLLVEQETVWERLPHQEPPTGDWFGWIMEAGRGSGKSFAANMATRDHLNGPACINGTTPDAQTVPVHDMSVFMTIDLAISTKRTADPTVMAVWGVDESQNLLLLDLARRRIPGPAQLKLLEKINHEWQPERIVCEDVG